MREFLKAIWSEIRADKVSVPRTVLLYGYGAWLTFWACTLGVTAAAGFALFALIVTLNPKDAAKVFNSVWTV